jgi:hypothetical protein
MARKVLLFLSTIVFSAVATNGCAPELTTTDPTSGGSGGSSSSSGDGGSNSSSSSSSSSGSMGSEDCLNGSDDDGDGNSDCADSDCNVDYECTAAPPTGWSITLVERGSGQSPSDDTCDDGMPAETFYTGMAGPAECSCMCGSLTGAQCKFLCYPGATMCGAGEEDWTSAFNNVGDCEKPSNLLGNAASLSCRIAGSATQPGSCTASVVDFPNKDTWSGWIQACTTKQTGSGCGAGAVCVRKPDSDSSCIGQPGQHVCPAGWSDRTDAYESATDTRGCTQCTCTAAPTCTGGLYRFYDADSCTNQGTDPAVDITGTSCQDVSHLLDQSSWSIRYLVPPIAGGTCMKGGGMPTGSITPTGEITFCCK